jgi:hypothetical protein
MHLKIRFFPCEESSVPKSWDTSKIWTYDFTKKPSLCNIQCSCLPDCQTKEPHTIGETLAKRCALETVELVCGLEQREKLEVVPLSNDVIRSRIFYLCFSVTHVKIDIEELAALTFPFIMQLDETTDISQCSQFIVFVRCMHGGAIKEEFLFWSYFWKPQRTSTFWK